MKSRKNRKWIRGATKRKGALHRKLGIPKGRRIPLQSLRDASKMPGALGREARLALTLRRLRKQRRK